MSYCLLALLETVSVAIDIVLVVLVFYVLIHRAHPGSASLLSFYLFALLSCVIVEVGIEIGID